MKKVYVTILIGASLVLSGVARAESSGDYISTGTWVQILMGVTLALVGAYVKGIKDSLAGQIREIKDDLRTIREDVRAIERDYQTQSDLKQIVESAIEPLKVELGYIKDKLK